MTNFLAIELIEARIAPAPVFTFTDADGDRVKIISSLGDLNAPGVATKTIAGNLSGGDIGTVKIARDMIGGAGGNSGKVDAHGKLTSLAVGGSVIGGAGRQDTDFGHVGQIHSSSGDAVIDKPPGAATDAIVARIASVTIKGAVIGAPNPFFQSGFVAQQIGSFKVGAFIAHLTAQTDAPIVLTPLTGNETIHEV